MNIYLFDEQIDLILNSLEYYLYTYNYFYPRRRVSIDKEDNLKKCLIRDTYEQILTQTKQNKIAKPLETVGVKRSYKKIQKTIDIA